MKKILLLLLILVLVVGCTEQFKKGGTPLSDNGPEEIEESPTQEVKSNWQDIPLKDVATQKTFKISDFRGKPVLLESFAVWCPTCTKQQKNIKELHKIVGDDVVSISLDTDPNEDADYVNKHITENGFDWLYAISPKELATGLIDEFGINVVNAPSAPVVLVCADGSTRFLGRGLKSVSELQEEIKKGC